LASQPVECHARRDTDRSGDDNRVDSADAGKASRRVRRVSDGLKGHILVLAPDAPGIRRHR